MKVPYNRHFYPKQTITISEFANKMNSCLILSFTNNDKIKEFYDKFIEHNFSLTYHWIEVNGYDTVEEWTEEYFKDWDFDLHSTILKSVFKDKYNNVKPQIPIKQVMINIANSTIKELKNDDK